MGTGINTVPADGSTGFAEDVAQFANGFTGVWDLGTITLLSPLPAPSVPTVNTSATGLISGSNYQWAVGWISGTFYKTQPPSPVYTPNVVGYTPIGTKTSQVTVSDKEAVVSISGLTPPTGAIGWYVARNKSGGSTWYVVPGSYTYKTSSGSMPSSFTDNVVDSSLVTTAPTVNSTGTTITNVPYVVARTTGPFQVGNGTTGGPGSAYSLISNTSASSTTGLFVPASVIGANTVMRFRFRGGYLNSYGSNYSQAVNLVVGGTTIWGYSNGSETGSDGQVNPIQFDVELSNLDSTSANWFEGQAIVGKATGVNAVESGTATYPTPQFFAYAVANSGYNVATPNWNLNTTNGFYFDVQATSGSVRTVYVSQNALVDVV